MQYPTQTTATSAPPSRVAAVRLRQLVGESFVYSRPTPEVGLFWIDDSGKMFAAGVSLREAEDYGEFRIFDKSHLDLWDAAICANPEWRHLEYEEVPRGRVVYRRDPVKSGFIVYMPRRIGKYRNKVIRRFHLPAGYVLFDFDDEHYQMGVNVKIYTNKTFKKDSPGRFVLRKKG